MGWFARWRRGRAVQRSPVTDAEWSAVTRRFSFLQALNGDEQSRLRDLVAAFLNEKSLQGAGGLVMTRDMELVIAAQACLLVLNLDLDYYGDWVEVIVYPDEFIVDHEYTDEDGIVHHVRAPLSGEAWEQGPVVLSWQDAEAAGGGDGYNVTQGIM
jgi:Mlc titration factor MtfA (ptsG expression regulator)